MLNLMVTLWPELEGFPHFPRFSKDERLTGIRLNSAMIDSAELNDSLKVLEDMGDTLPLWFDIKGRQLRVEQVYVNSKYLDIRVNHPIEVETPVPVLFKAGEDRALLQRIEDGGRRLIFDHWPRWMVKAGESLHIRHDSLKIGEPFFTDRELAKIERVKAAGFTRYFLSYVGSQAEVDQFRELVGYDAEIYLKIEDQQGLDFVANDFKKEPNIRLVAACGDLYVEVGKPHDILPALKLIIDKDPDACVGSRMLLSVINKNALPDHVEERLRSIIDRKLASKQVEDIITSILWRKPPPWADAKSFRWIGCNPVPSFADFGHLAWLADIGYRTFMLCDEICLHEDMLGTAVAAFDAFRDQYQEDTVSRLADILAD